MDDNIYIYIYIYILNDISIPSELFSAEIWLISTGLIVVTIKKHFWILCFFCNYKSEELSKIAYENFEKFRLRQKKLHSYLAENWIKLVLQNVAKFSSAKFWEVFVSFCDQQLVL